MRHVLVSVPHTSMGHNLARPHHATPHLSSLQHNHIHAMRGKMQRCRWIFTAR